MVTVIPIVTALHILIPWRQASFVALGIHS